MKNRYISDKVGWGLAVVVLLLCVDRVGDELRESGQKRAEALTT
jgi:hypothetical protein